MKLLRELLSEEVDKVLELTSLDSIPDEDVLKAALESHNMMIGFHGRFIGNALETTVKRARTAFENHFDRSFAHDDELDDVEIELTDLAYDTANKVLYALVRCEGKVFNRTGPDANGKRKHLSTEIEEYAFKLTSVDDAHKVKYKEAYQLVNDDEETLDVAELCKLSSNLRHYFQ